MGNRRARDRERKERRSRAGEGSRRRTTSTPRTRTRRARTRSTPWTPSRATGCAKRRPNRKPETPLVRTRAAAPRLTTWKAHVDVAWCNADDGTFVDDSARRALHAMSRVVSGWLGVPTCTQSASLRSRRRVRPCRASGRGAGVPNDDAGADLERWMREDSAFEPLGVRVAHLGPDRGFCGVATRDIRADDVLVRVPRSRMLTAEDARARAPPWAGRASS